MMTIENAKATLVEWCKSQIGYHEGAANANKYAMSSNWDERLYGFSADNVPWCDVFVDAAFIECFGYDDGTAMTNQQPRGFASCSMSAMAYKNNGAFYKTPELGDQIFFFVDGDINHTGIVVNVNDLHNTIQCVEGNYSDSVAYTSYTITNPTIAGFGRPNWGVIIGAETEDEQYDIIHGNYRRTYLHLEYGDGINNPHQAVKAWQNLLLCWGKKLGICGADGEFGEATRKATLEWQKEAKAMGADVEVNGIVDEDDWVEIINVPG